VNDSLMGVMNSCGKNLIAAIRIAALIY